MENIFYKQATKLEEKILLDHYQNKQKEFGIEDGTIFSLYVELLRKSDSIFTLIDLQKTGGVPSLIRSNFEIYIYLEFILQKDTSFRAKAYYLNYNLEKAKLYDKVMNDSDESKELRNFLDIDAKGFAEHYQGDLEGKVAKQYRDEYKEHFKEMPKAPQKWYNFNGKIANFRSLCQYLGLEHMYDSLFVTMSSDTHSADSYRNLLIEKDYLATLVNKDEIQNLSITAEGILLECMKMVLKYYDLEELRKQIFFSLKINRSIQNGTLKLN